MSFHCWASALPLVSCCDFPTGVGHGRDWYKGSGTFPNRKFSDWTQDKTGVPLLQMQRNGEGGHLETEHTHLILPAGIQIRKFNPIFICTYWDYFYLASVAKIENQ